MTTIMLAPAPLKPAGIHFCKRMHDQPRLAIGGTLLCLESSFTRTHSEPPHHSVLHPIFLAVIGPPSGLMPSALAFGFILYFQCFRDHPEMKKNAFVQVERFWRAGILPCADGGQNMPAQCRQSAECKLHGTNKANHDKLPSVTGVFTHQF